MPQLKRLRHELFAREFIVTDNQSEAYRRARENYCKRGYKPKPLRHHKSAAVCAVVILRRPEVRARIAELRADIMRKSDITIEKILNDYQHALDIAKSDGKPDAIVNAATAQAKLVGLMRERQEIGQPGDFESMETVNEVLAAVSRELGATAAKALAVAMGVESEALPDVEGLEPPTDAVN